MVSGVIVYLPADSASDPGRPISLDPRHDGEVKNVLAEGKSAFLHLRYSGKFGCEPEVVSGLEQMVVTFPLDQVVQKFSAELEASQPFLLLDKTTNSADAVLRMTLSGLNARPLAAKPHATITGSVLYPGGFERAFRSVDASNCQALGVSVECEFSDADKEVEIRTGIRLSTTSVPIHSEFLELSPTLKLKWKDGGKELIGINVTQPLRMAALPDREYWFYSNRRPLLVSVVFFALALCALAQLQSDWRVGRSWPLPVHCLAMLGVTSLFVVLHLWRAAGPWSWFLVAPVVFGSPFFLAFPITREQRNWTEVILDLAVAGLIAGLFGMFAVYVSCFGNLRKHPNPMTDNREWLLVLLALLLVSLALHFFHECNKHRTGQRPLVTHLLVAICAVLFACMPMYFAGMAAYERYWHVIWLLVSIGVCILKFFNYGGFKGSAQGPP
jgi:hypothetical protein